MKQVSRLGQTGREWTDEAASSSLESEVEGVKTGVSSCIGRVQGSAHGRAKSERACRV